MSTNYIATFHTHFAASSTYRTMTEAGISAKLAPVPRALSAGCGTCVRFTSDTPCRRLLHPEFIQVVRCDGEDYTIVLEGDP